jgi:hypothetical protein
MIEGVYPSRGRPLPAWCRVLLEESMKSLNRAISNLMSSHQWEWPWGTLLMSWESLGWEWGSATKEAIRAKHR